MSIDISAIVTTVIPTVAGVGTGVFGIIWGVHTYKQGQIAKRQEVLFPLIEEFNNVSNALARAKKILDDIAISPQSGWQKSNRNYDIMWEDIQGDYKPLKDFLKKELKLNWVEDSIFTKEGDIVKIDNGTQYVSLELIKGQGLQRTRVEIKVNNYESYNFIAKTVNSKTNLLWYYYHISNLQSILRNHEDREITDPGEVIIRESFDALLDFFGKLGYLIEVELMKKEEALYFQYYINKAIKNDDIITYARIYQFGLFALLIEKLNLQPKESLEELTRLVKP